MKMWSFNYKTIHSQSQAGVQTMSRLDGFSMYAKDREAHAAMVSTKGEFFF